MVNLKTSHSSQHIITHSLHFPFQPNSNTFWQIWQNGFAKTTPNARWFFVPTAGGPKPGHPGPYEPDLSDKDAVMCKTTGGTVEYTMCKCETKDFFNTCNTCGVVAGTACDTCMSPTAPRLNCYCKCPADMCFSEGVGCVPCPVPVPSF